MTIILYFIPLLLPIGFTVAYYKTKGKYKNLSTAGQINKNQISQITLYLTASGYSYIGYYLFSSFIMQAMWYFLAILMVITGYTINKNGSIIHTLFSRLMVAVCFFCFAISNIVSNYIYSSYLNLFLALIGISTLYLLHKYNYIVNNVIQLYLTYILNIWLLIFIMHAV